MTMGERIRKVRKEKGLTQVQLANLIGRTESSIRKYENDSVEPPGTVIEKIANALNISPLELLLSNYQTNIDVSKAEIANDDLLELLPTKENIEKYPEYFDYAIDSAIKYVNNSFAQYDLNTKEKITFDRKFYEKSSIDFKAEVFGILIERIIVDKKNNVIRIYYKY